MAEKDVVRCGWSVKEPIYIDYHDTEWGIPEYDPRALYEKIARYGKREVNRLMQNAGIIRSEPKIQAAIRGAQVWLDIQEKEPGGFTELLWKHVGGKPKQNSYKTLKQVPPKTAMSEGMSKELKARGFNFVGPVIVYAFAQAVGMVNDHIVSCHRHGPVAKLGKHGPH